MNVTGLPRDLTAEIPVYVLSDGRKFITDETVADMGQPALAFINRFSNYWHRDRLRSGWVGPVEGDTNQ